MGIKWTDEQIKALLEKAKALYGVDIPLAEEIMAYNHFIYELSNYDKPDDKHTLKISEVRFSWWRKSIARLNELIMPEEIVMIVYKKAKEILDTKCNRLSDLIGIDKRNVRKASSTNK